MREIKYQYWDFKDRKMSGMEDNGVVRKAYKSESAGVWQDCSLGLLLMRHNENKGALREYTGLKDMDGAPVYEGDVVQFTYWWFDGNIAESNLTGTIVYGDACMSFQLKGIKNKEWEQFTGYENDSDYLTPFSELNFEEADFKVIGNIYSNPELIKEAK